jgi:hypothetical protein
MTAFETRYHLRYQRLRLNCALQPVTKVKNAPKGGCFLVRWDRIVASMSELTGAISM